MKNDLIAETFGIYGFLDDKEIRELNPHLPNDDFIKNLPSFKIDILFSGKIKAVIDDFYDFNLDVPIPKISIDIAFKEYRGRIVTRFVGWI
ncbi:MAG: hypothetical protein IPM82_16215 [Saprospiraceae bacterium]|nr:hypothetical protein [Saprospiraceae bacterium]